MSEKSINVTFVSTVFHVHYDDENEPKSEMLCSEASEAVSCISSHIFD
jgi:hypothetical protein